MARILIVDDSLTARSIMDRLIMHRLIMHRLIMDRLIGAKHEQVFASGGAEALFRR